MAFPDGSVYEGEFRDGAGHGKGRAVFSDGSIYDGEMTEGKMTGKGIFLYADGRTYAGMLSDGEPKGHGRFTLPDGRSFEGDWDGQDTATGVTATSDSGEKLCGRVTCGTFVPSGPAGTETPGT